VEFGTWRQSIPSTTSVLNIVFVSTVKNMATVRFFYVIFVTFRSSKNAEVKGTESLCIPVQNTPLRSRKFASSQCVVSVC
jgi:hypothetical protein